LHSDSSDDVDSIEKEELDIDEGSKGVYEEESSLNNNSGMKNPLDFSNMLFSE
jgi:hypothetical protein